MKKIFLISIFIIISFLANAQLQKPFPDSTGAWRIVDSGRYFIMDNDTIIGSNTYEILYSGTPDIYDSTSLVQSVGCYRIDSLKIYYRDFENTFYDTSEFLLYDFGLQIQDTFWFPYYNMACQDSVGMILTDIDSALVSGEWLKRWSFSPYICSSAPFGLVWYYGIGSEIGFFSDEMLLSQDVQLSCFHHLGMDYVFNLNGFASCYELGYNENQISNFIFYPNPSNGNFAIETENNLNSSVEILDLNGKLIYSTTISSNQQEINLNVEDGIYIFVLQNSKGISRKKIVVSN